MALFKFDGNGDLKAVTRFPYAGAYQDVRRLMTKAEVDAIMNYLAHEVEVRPEILTTSWIPGADWTDSPLERIYEVCGDEVLAAKMYGLFMWDVMQQHPEKWSFGHYELDGVPIKGMTYFRVTE